MQKHAYKWLPHTDWQLLKKKEEEEEKNYPCLILHHLCNHRTLCIKNMELRLCSSLNTSLSSPTSSITSDPKQTSGDRPVMGSSARTWPEEARLPCTQQSVNSSKQTNRQSSEGTEGCKKGEGGIGFEAGRVKRPPKLCKILYPTASKGLVVSWASIGVKQLSLLFAPSYIIF